MKTIIAGLLVSATSLFGQNIRSISEGPVYDRQGHMVSYRYVDGTRDLYAYDSGWRMTSFTNRSGKVTHFQPSGAVAKSSNGQTVAPAATPIDSTLFTNYFPNMADSVLTWIVCGSTSGSSGCYGSGTLGPFGKAGAIIEGYPTTDLSTNTVTRSIYVVDTAAGTNQNAVTLYVYTKTDMISPSFDMVTVTLSNTINLPLVGGTSASASMAANKKFVVIGTNLSDQAVEVQKKNFSITPIAGFSPPIPVTAITADQYGYITVSFGSISGQDGFVVLNSQGVVEEDGGGYQFMASTDQAALPSTFP